MAQIRLCLTAVTLLVVLLVTACDGGSEADRADPQTQPAKMTAAATLNPIAKTQYGEVEGALKNGVLAFKGVRYGADTATTRFSAPAKPAPWSALRAATTFGATCPQTPSSNPVGLFSSWAPQPTPPIGEDCLFLNVWTPAIADGGKRPVMVWFHGGGFSTGSGSSAAYEGIRLAKRGDVVVVTVNHRLNVFGYLALAHYGAGFEDSAAAGVLDMVLALEWVRDNIQNFGGDPNTVMIFGESGGGAKVSTLMATPAAEGLFHRAVVQSGALIHFPQRALAQAAADRLVANLNLTRKSIDQIKKLPLGTILAARKDTGAGSAPTIDGRTLTRHPFEPDAAPSARQVPLMLGSNRTENALFAGAANPNIFDLTWERLSEQMQRAYPDKNVEMIIAGYRALQPDSTPTDIYLEATTDSRWLAGHVLQAERKVKQGGAPTYLYLFNWDTPVDGGKWRSPHALEIGFVFDNVANSESMSGVGEAQQRVAEIMADTWIAFARTGQPDNPRIPTWPAYNLQTRPVMVFDEVPELVNDARASQRALIDDRATYLNRYERRSD